MNKKNCREALEIYKKFLERTDNVAAFLKVAEVCHLYIEIFTKKIYISNSFYINSRPEWIKVIYQI
jgi:hypothetical protein